MMIKCRRHIGCEGKVKAYPRRILDHFPFVSSITYWCKACSRRVYLGDFAWRREER